MQVIHHALLTAVHDVAEQGTNDETREQACNNLVVCYQEPSIVIDEVAEEEETPVVQVKEKHNRKKKLRKGGTHNNKSKNSNNPKNIESAAISLSSALVGSFSRSKTVETLVSVILYR